VQLDLVQILQQDLVYCQSNEPSAEFLYSTDIHEQGTESLSRTRFELGINQITLHILNGHSSLRLLVGNSVNSFKLCQIYAHLCKLLIRSAWEVVEVAATLILGIS
jgi:hypothetical protein